MRLLKLPPTFLHSIKVLSTAAGGLEKVYKHGLSTAL